MPNDLTQKTPASNQKISAGSAANSLSTSAQRPNRKHDELRLLINSRNPLITVETTEEDRLKDLLLMIATELNVPLYTWSAITGLARFNGAPIYGTDQPEQALANIALIAGDAIFLLKDFARYCDNDRICRRVRDLAGTFRVARRSFPLDLVVRGLAGFQLGGKVPRECNSRLGFFGVLDLQYFHFRTQINR